LFLANAGARVVLVERMAVPRYKTCGGGVVARAVDRLPGCVGATAERRCRTVELGFPDDGSRFVVERDQPIVTMTMRSELDRALLDVARNAGAEVRDRCAFRGLLERSRGLEVETERGPLRARFLIGADGANGPVARHAGWDDVPYCVPALEAEVRVDAATLQRFSGTARFDFGLPADGYAWVFPKRRHLSVGLLHMRRGARGLKALLPRYLDAVGLSRVDGIDVHGSLIPVRPRRGGFVRGRVLLAGDSAGLADPVTGEGISHAIESGRVAASALLNGELVPAEVARLYRRGLERRILGELRFARPLAHLLYRHPRLRRFAFRRLGQSMCRVITDVIVGRGSYRRILSSPANYLRLLRRVALP